MATSLLGGRYRLERQLSSTQMAEVWVARDPVLERRVVVKLLAPDADRQRFEREARAVAALAHPNIVQLYDYGEERGRPYMVLEHVPGGTLVGRLREGERLDDAETRAIATDIAAGLAHAHAHGVVHRDLKPGNILFDAEGRAKIADFGIARVQGIDTLTEDGTVLGTAAYMSPEQVAGEPATSASDVYAFGILLFRMLTGRLPFDAPNALDVARMQRDVEAPPVRAVRADAPADLAALATAALAKRPSARPADGATLLDGLQPPTAAAQEAVTAVSDAPTRLISAPAAARRLWPRLALLGAVLVAAGIAAAVLVFGSPSSTPAVTTTPTGTHRSTTSAGTTTTSTGPPTTTGTTSPTTTHTTPATSHTTTAAPPPRTTSTHPTSTSATTIPTVATTTATETTASTTTPTTTAGGTTSGP